MVCWSNSLSLPSSAPVSSSSISFHLFSEAFFGKQKRRKTSKEGKLMHPEKRGRTKHKTRESRTNFFALQILFFPRRSWRGFQMKQNFLVGWRIHASQLCSREWERGEDPPLFPKIKSAKHTKRRKRRISDCRAGSGMRGWLCEWEEKPMKKERERES